jgi:hypothetical protein
MRCPHCQAADLDPARHDDTGMVTCRCGHRAFAGYVAEADALSARSSWLVDRVVAGDPAPAPEVQHAYAIWSAPGSATPGSAGRDGHPGPPGHPGHPGAASRAAPSAQTLLLGVGALLLVIAGAVFAAVVWDRLGALGQVAVMLLATTGVGALAIRLRTHLAGTAEALAVVAAGLAAVDLLAAPMLGLLPERWITDPTVYPALALAGLGTALLLLHRRFTLRAWSWLGWLALLVGAACLIPAVSSATGSPAWTAAAVAMPALASIAMLAAAAHPRGWAGQDVELRTIGAVGLALGALATASAAMDRDALPGALVTTATCALAVGVWARLDPDGETARPVPLGAAALSGTTAALLLALPQDPQPVWLAAAVTLAGLTVGMVIWVLRPEPLLALVGACAVWIPWAAIRINVGAEISDSDLVAGQLSLLALLVGVLTFVIAWWIPVAGWIAAGLCAAAALLAPTVRPDPIEAYTMAFSALLLAAGLLWRRRGTTPSLQWLGPAVAMALIPSAIATWAAPWALDVSDLGTGWHVLRLGVVLGASVIAMVVGARLHLGGLLVPAAVALVIASLAQVWSGLSNLPRWIGLAIAGTLLVLAGARIEWLRREGRRAVGWMANLQ